MQREHEQEKRKPQINYNNNLNNNNATTTTTTTTTKQKQQQHLDGRQEPVRIGRTCWLNYDAFSFYLLYHWLSSCVSYAVGRAFPSSGPLLNTGNNPTKRSLFSDSLICRSVMVTFEELMVALRVVLEIHVTSFWRESLRGNGMKTTRTVTTTTTTTTTTSET